MDFPDFAFWRLKVVSGSLNGGFGRAYRMAAEDLLADISDFFDFYDFEAGAVEHMNSDHADAVALYATQLCGAREGAWQLIGIDPGRDPDGARRRDPAPGLPEDAHRPARGAPDAHPPGERGPEPDLVDDAGSGHGWDTMGLAMRRP